MLPLSKDEEAAATFKFNKIKVKEISNSKRKVSFDLNSKISSANE